jgi:SAM-dependent methyltransferase
MQPNKSSPRGSTILPAYAKGDYFQDASRHNEDSPFKANAFLKLFRRWQEQTGQTVRSIVDVGCGSGDIIKLIVEALAKSGSKLESAKGYDVSPHVRNLHHESIKYVLGDFCESEERVDLVTLFDVFEHVPDPIGFIQRVAERCDLIAFHIPLENNLNVAFRNMFRAKLKNPGHLIFMDCPMALNLLALSGLTVLDYDYTFGFLTPSRNSGLARKVARPIRNLLAKMSPWLVSKTIGGTSLIVMARTPLGLQRA